MTALSWTPTPIGHAQRTPRLHQLAKGRRWRNGPLELAPPDDDIHCRNSVRILYEGIDCGTLYYAVADHQHPVRGWWTSGLACMVFGGAWGATLPLAAGVLLDNMSDPDWVFDAEMVEAHHQLLRPSSETGD